MRYGFRWMLPGQFKFPSAKMIPKAVSGPRVTARPPQNICNECQRRRFDQQRKSAIHISVKKGTSLAAAAAAAESDRDQHLHESIDRPGIIEDQRQQLEDARGGAG